MEEIFVPGQSYKHSAAAEEFLSETVSLRRDIPAIELDLFALSLGFAFCFVPLSRPS